MYAFKYLDKIEYMCMQMQNSYFYLNIDIISFKLFLK